MDGGDFFVAEGAAFAELPGLFGDADGDGVVEVVDVHLECDGEGRLNLARRHHLSRFVFGDGVGRHQTVELLAEVALREAAHLTGVDQALSKYCCCCIFHCFIVFIRLWIRTYFDIRVSHLP